MDQIKIKIEEDGTITTETDGITPANHQSADLFLETVIKFAGGPVTERKKDKYATHTHTHGNLVHEH